MHLCGRDSQLKLGKKSQFPQTFQGKGRALEFSGWIDQSSTKDQVSYSSIFLFALESSQKYFGFHIFQRMELKLVISLLDSFPSPQAFASIPSDMSQADVRQRYQHEFGRWDKGLLFVLDKSFLPHIDGPDLLVLWA